MFLFCPLLAANMDKLTHSELDSLFLEQWDKPEYHIANTAKDETYLTNVEKEIFYYLNLVRINPELFATTYVKSFNGLPGFENHEVFKERKQSLIDSLVKMPAKEILYPSKIIYNEARCFAAEGGKTGIIGHSREGTECSARFAECCSYVDPDGLFIVLDLLMDVGDSNAKLGHRKMCLGDFGMLGVSVQPHSVNGNIAVLQFGYNPENIYKKANYTGHLTIDGKMHGKGTFTFENGNIYEGDWVEDTMHGKGKYTLPDNNTYEGEWANGKMHGKGVFTFSNGDKYTGEWKNGEKHGKGLFEFVDGDKYEGEWKNGEKDGKGIFTFSNGDRYEGEWANGRMHGKGVFIFASGDKYDGEWGNEKKHGNGIYIFANGMKLESEWLNDIRQECQKITFNPQ